MLRDFLLAAEDGAEDPRGQRGEMAVWLDRSRWSGNPKTDDYQENEIPLEMTNWLANPRRRSGVDWSNGVSPNPHRYPYGDESFKSHPNDEEMLRAIAFLKLDVERRKARQ